ncbi:MAG: aspartyl protease family protein [Chloroflexi bacterium]|nr:aspartyl protease family protein [Chloroflexota bacterium]
MGLFNVEIDVANQEHKERHITIDALVDTGAFLSAVPASLLHELDVTPTRRQTVRFADGSTRRMELGLVWMQIDGRETVTQVMFNEEGTQPLLGALTLEELFLVVDPVEQKLAPMGAIMWGR